MATEKPKGLSFGFIKKKENLIIRPKSEELEADGDVDFVTSIDEKEIKSVIAPKRKEELVIPLIKNNNWRLSREKRMKKAENKEGVSGGKTEASELDNLAIQELLQDAAEAKDSWKKITTTDSNVVIPLMFQNKVPVGFEEDENFDVSIRPEEPSMENYEAVPVEEFGLAMLRGMGWKPGEPIGDTNKSIAAIVEPKIRPKGLGLGAEIAPPKSVGNLTKAEAKQLILGKGAYVCVQSGEHKGFYGQIECFDDDMSRATVKLALKNIHIYIPVPLLQLVDKKEFDKESKVINRAKYEEYKQKSEDGNKIKSEDHKESKHKEIKISNSDQSSWLAPNLKVRVIDKTYKNGKYYKEKVVIDKLLSSNKCICKTEDRRSLEDIKANMLETTIPKYENAKVLILRGKYKHQYGIVVSRDKRKNTAIVEVSDSRSKLELSYDDICDFVR